MRSFYVDCLRLDYIVTLSFCEDSSQIQSSKWTNALCSACVCYIGCRISTHPHVQESAGRIKKSRWFVNMCIPFIYEYENPWLPMI